MNPVSILQMRGVRVMITKNKFKLVFCLVFAITLITFGFNPVGEAFDIEKYFDMLNTTELEGDYFTMVDQEGNSIMRTARIIHVGDEFITGDNRVFRVVRVEGNTAEARYLRTLSYEKVIEERNTVARVMSWLEGFRSWAINRSVPVQQEQRIIAIYHTHGAEAYVPSDGAESIDEGGGIFNVGDSFAQALEEKGITILKSEETHVPHDAGAYQRSRRTFEEFAKENPDAVFDVHRDAVPVEEYLAEIEGEERVQVQLVVGRQNQNMAVTREFAEELKATADEMHPDLVKGIFMARGNYNQDLSPRAMLLEVGTHENNREDAEESAALFANVVSGLLYGTEEGEEFLSPDVTGEPSGTGFRSALWIIGLLIIGVGAYLVISVGGIDELKAKIEKFRKEEFTNFLGRFRKDKSNSDDDNKSGEDNNNPTEGE